MTTQDTTQDDKNKTSTDVNTDAAGSGKVDDAQDGKAGSTDDKSTDDNGLKSALKKERERANAAEKALRDQELAKLPELERFKSETERLTKENEKLTIENQRMKIGMELKLPWNMAKRISGDTEAEMRSDAADLLRSMKSDEDDASSKDKDKNKADRDAANKAKTNDGKQTGSAGKPDMNTLLRRAAGRTAR